MPWRIDWYQCLSGSGSAEWLKRAFPCLVLESLSRWRKEFALETQLSPPDWERRMALGGREKKSCAQTTLRWNGLGWWRASLAYDEQCHQWKEVSHPSSGVIFIAIVKSADTGARAEIGSEQAGSKQALFEGEWLTIMVLNRHLRYLSWNPALKFEVMSHSSSSSQTIGGTTRPIFVSGSLLGAKEDEDDEKDEVNGEDGGAGGGVLALLVGRTTSLFLFLVGSRIMELDVGQWSWRSNNL